MTISKRSGSPSLRPRYAAFDYRAMQLAKLLTHQLSELQHANTAEGKAGKNANGTGVNLQQQSPSSRRDPHDASSSIINHISEEGEDEEEEALPEGGAGIETVMPPVPPKTIISGC